MKTIINKYDAITLLLNDIPQELHEDFRKTLSELTDQEIARDLNMIVIRKGFFTQK